MFEPEIYEVALWVMLLLWTGVVLRLLKNIMEDRK